MEISALISQYGYVAVMVGCLLEGETVLLLAGYAAKQGWLHLPMVMALGACMGALSDMGLFALGRRHGDAVLRRWPRLADYRDRLDGGQARWGAGMVVAVRFMYGMRIAGPILLGTTRMPWQRFVVFNALGAVLWAVLVAGTGWLFGHAAEVLLGKFRHIEGWLLLALVIVGWGVMAWRRKRSVRGNSP